MSLPTETLGKVQNLLNCSVSAREHLSLCQRKCLERPSDETKQNVVYVAENSMNSLININEMESDIRSLLSEFNTRKESVSPDSMTWKHAPPLLAGMLSFPEIRSGSLGEVCVSSIATLFRSAVKADSDLLPVPDSKKRVSASNKFVKRAIQWCGSTLAESIEHQMCNNKLLTIPSLDKILGENGVNSIDRDGALLSELKNEFDLLVSKSSDSSNRAADNFVENSKCFGSRKAIREVSKDRNNAGSISKRKATAYIVANQLKRGRLCEEKRKENDSLNSMNIEIKEKVTRVILLLNENMHCTKMQVKKKWKFIEENLSMDEKLEVELIDVSMMMWCSMATASQDICEIAVLAWISILCAESVAHGNCLHCNIGQKERVNDDSEATKLLSWLACPDSVETRQVFQNNIEAVIKELRNPSLFESGNSGPVADKLKFLYLSDRTESCMRVYGCIIATLLIFFCKSQISV